MLIKIHEAYRRIVILCDEDLFGNFFEEGDLQLDLTGEFFKGEKKANKDLSEILEDLEKEDAIFLFVGDKSCNLAYNKGIVEPNGIKKIQNIPLVMVLF